jgi:hypothetical protein
MVDVLDFSDDVWRWNSERNGVVVMKGRKKLVWYFGESLSTLGVLA